MAASHVTATQTVPSVLIVMSWQVNVSVDLVEEVAPVVIAKTYTMVIQLSSVTLVTVIHKVLPRNSVIEGVASVCVRLVSVAINVTAVIEVQQENCQTVYHVGNASITGTELLEI